MSDVILVAGLGYGDEGKGALVDHLTRRHDVHTIVRYNGGAQAGHNVVTPEGLHHPFSQFGSGMLARPDVETHLSRYMLVNPITLYSEGMHLQEILGRDVFAQVTIDRSALVTTQFQVVANRLREMHRSNGRHGSCGMGIGETMSDYLKWGRYKVVLAEDLENQIKLRRKLKFLRELKMEELKPILPDLPETGEVRGYLEFMTDDVAFNEYLSCLCDTPRMVRLVDEDFLEKRLRLPGTVVFEGAQGVLLDQKWGWQPHTTWTNITYENAFDLLKGFKGHVMKLGVLRAHATRHGAGPFVTEDPSLKLEKDHNVWTPWQQNFRIGHFDAVASRYAIQVIGGVDALVLTHLDCFVGERKICTSYQMRGEEWSDLPVGSGSFETQAALAKTLLNAKPIYQTLQGGAAEEIADRLGVPLFGYSFGPTAHEFMEKP